MKQILLSIFTTGILLGFSNSAFAEFKLTILHLNDLHSRIESINKYDSTCDAEGEAEGECFGGIARIKSKIDERKAALEAAGQNVLVLDAGDQFQGSLFYTTYKGEAAVEFLNDMSLDAMAVGNHEFDDGPKVLEKFIEQANFPIISGNIDVSNDQNLYGKIRGTLVVEKAGERIGLVSVVAEDTSETSSPGDSIRFIQSEDYLKGVVEAFESAGINKIIALTHVGLSRDMEIALNVAGIDVIVGGHSHTLLSNTQERAEGSYPKLIPNPEGNLVPIVQAYAYGKYLGEIEIEFDNQGQVVSAVGEPILLDNSVIPDQNYIARVKELAEPIEELKNSVIGSTTDVIDGDRTSCRAGECQMGNLVADAMLDQVKDQGVQVAIQNGGGLRASIDAGEITMGEVLTVLPFQNTLSTFQLKGADIVEALENGVSEVEEGAGRFPQVAGLKYQWSRSEPANQQRIKKVEIMENGNWKPIDYDKSYGVVSNNYMRSGGDGYNVFEENGTNAYDFGPGLEEVVADYLAANQNYQPYVDGRISEIK